MCHRLSPIRLRATISVWNGVSFSIGGSHATGFKLAERLDLHGLVHREQQVGHLRLGIQHRGQNVVKFRVGA